VKSRVEFVGGESTRETIRRSWVKGTQGFASTVKWGESRRVIFLNDRLRENLEVGRGKLSNSCAK
jgi:hypothetical protein